MQYIEYDIVAIFRHVLRKFDVRCLSAIFGKYFVTIIIVETQKKSRSQILY